MGFSPPRPSSENPSARDLKVAVLMARWNEAVNAKLLQGAFDCFTELEGKSENIKFYFVPGSYELPFLAKKLAESGKYDALVCLGTIIKGETDHDQYIASFVFPALGEIGLASGVPIGMGVLTTNDLEQALARAGGSMGNKGREAMLAALEMAVLSRSLS